MSIASRAVWITPDHHERSGLQGVCFLMHLECALRIVQRKCCRPSNATACVQYGAAYIVYDNDVESGSEVFGPSLTDPAESLTW